MDLHHPLNSLQKGHWFKLICGASLQYLPAVRNLALAYTLAGADCIDVAADPAVVRAAQEGVSAAKYFLEFAQNPSSSKSSPWLMASLNDGEDPHFRKAEFNPEDCPTDCPRPCVTICPAQAIRFDQSVSGFSGVMQQRCYGCGRCLPICPVQHISTASRPCTPEVVQSLVLAGQIDAIEIHTQVGRLAEFQGLWQAIAPVAHRLKLVAVSCPDGEGLIDYLWSLYHILAPLACPLVWQTDGRPMSGDIGNGATRAAVNLSQKVLRARLPGYVQLAGGTNAQTVAKLRAKGLLNPTITSSRPGLSDLAQQYVAGVAYGSFARALLSPVLEQLDYPTASNQSYCLEETPELLNQAVTLARSLVSQLKSPGVPQPDTNHDVVGQTASLSPVAVVDKFDS